MATKTVKFNRNLLGYHVGDVAEIEMTDEPKALLEAGFIEEVPDEPTVETLTDTGDTPTGSDESGDATEDQPAPATGRRAKSAS